MLNLKVLSDAVESDFITLAPALQSMLHSLSIKDDRIVIDNKSQLASNIHVLAWLAAFASPAAKLAAHQAAWNIAAAAGIYCASTEALYRQIASQSVRGITVPAMNMRAIAFHSARGIFRSMCNHNVGAAIFELSRGEIGFTGQRPREYATVILSAAIAEGYSGPVFLQGDHFQISAARYRQDPQTEVSAVKDLIQEAVDAGFFNIDIDTSLLVDLSFESVDEQQKPNYELTAELAIYARSVQPAGVCLSLGGEIGEVGEHNSTVEELDAYLQGFQRSMPSSEATPEPGLAKVSVQTGTRHGGNILADGSVGDMNIDFTLIHQLSETCRTPHGAAGCVQHGASMLSIEKIARLPKANCIEVHLAAAFLNVVYEQLPTELVQQADNWIRDTHADEWKPDWSEPQFIHHGRRYPIGRNKRLWWDASPDHKQLTAKLADRAIEYFTALNVLNTHDQVSAITPPFVVPWSPGSSAENTRLHDESTMRDLAS